MAVGCPAQHLQFAIGARGTLRVRCYQVCGRRKRAVKDLILYTQASRYGRRWLFLEESVPGPPEEGLEGVRQGERSRRAGGSAHGSSSGPQCARYVLGTARQGKGGHNNESAQMCRGTHNTNRQMIKRNVKFTCLCRNETPYKAASANSSLISSKSRTEIPDSARSREELNSPWRRVGGQVICLTYTYSQFLRSD